MYRYGFNNRLAFAGEYTHIDGVSYWEWLECRQAALAGRACLRRLAPGSACRQEGKKILARTVDADGGELGRAQPT